MPAWSSFVLLRANAAETAAVTYMVVHLLGRKKVSGWFARGKAALERLIGAGLVHATGARERRHIRSTTVMGLVFFAVTAPYVILLGIAQAWLATAILVLGCISYLAPLALFPRGWLRLGKATPLYACSLVAYAFSALVGRSSNVHIAFLLGLCWAFNLYDMRRERLMFFLSQVVPLVGFTLIQVEAVPASMAVSLPPAVANGMEKSVGVVCIALVSFVFHHFYKQNQQNEDQLTDTNQRLETEVTQRAEAEQRAKTASEAKTAFLAMMGHELRTPMNGVLGMSQLLRRSTLTTEQEELLDGVDSSGRMLLMLLNDVLDFVAIRAGETPIAAVPCDLPTLIEDAITPFGASAEAKGLPLHLILHSDVPELVTSDPSRVRQIVACVVDNAVKYTEEGWVEVSVSWHSDKLLRVDVTDTGPGIPPDRRGAVFDEFTQSRAGPSRGTTGIGLGLATTRAVSQAMGGDVILTSSSESGSRFRIEVPLVVPPQPPKEHPLKHLKVGVKTDNPRANLALRHIIDRLGGAVVAAGEQAGVHVEIAPPSNRRPSLLPRLTLHPGPSSGPLSISGQVIRRTAVVRKLLPFVPRSSEKPTRILRALVVEDNLVNQKVMLGLLKRMNCEVEVAGEGKQALQAMVNAEFDIVFMDVEMPVMNGLEATRAIRATGNGIPIVGVSANAAPEEQQAGLDAGMDIYLAKPVRKRQLGDALRRFTESAD